MAFTATEVFDGYPTVAALTGNNGGSGWNAAWSTFAGNSWTVQDAPPGGQGCQAAFCVATSGYNTRTIATPQSVGVYQFMFYDTDGASGHLVDIYMRSSTNAGGGPNGTRFGISFNNSAGVTYGATDGQTYNTNIATYSLNTWHVMTVEWGHNSGKFRLKLDAGSFSSDFNQGSGTQEVDQLGLFNDGGNNTGFYVDDFGPSANPPCVSTNIKTFDGLAYASVKTVDGLAIASLKTWNGLA